MKTKMLFNIKRQINKNKAVLQNLAVGSAGSNVQQNGQRVATDRRASFEAATAQSGRRASTDRRLNDMQARREKPRDQSDAEGSPINQI